MSQFGEISQYSELLSSGVAVTLIPELYGAIYERMVNQPTRTSDVCKSRIGLLSFTDQMADLTKVDDPDGFLFTANSAIPVADAVRSYYEEVGRPCPLLGYVEANSDLSGKVIEVQAEHVAEEARRLEPVVRGMGHVAVVDQFVASGSTRALAKWIASRAGAHRVHSIDGNWYHDAQSVDVDKQGLTSVHKDFMRNVGKNAALKVLRGDFNLPPKLIIGPARAS